MNATEIYEKLQERHSTKIGEFVTDNPDPYIFVTAEFLPEVGAFLKMEPGLEFDFLESITGVDDTEQLYLVYHLFSYKHRHSVVLKLKMPYDQLDVPSCSKVWAAANWHEREQYDLFGFNFTDHPDLRRILLPDDWEGHPLLKSYVFPEEYHGIDHHRPDPKEQFKALDELAAKAADKVKEQRQKADDDSESTTTH